MTPPMTPEHRQEIAAWATGHSQGDVYCRELLAELDAQGDCDQHTKRIYGLRDEVDRLTTERDGARDACDMLRADRDAARAELAGLRQRVEGLVDLLDAGNWPWDGGVPAHWEEEPLTHRMADVLRAAVHNDPPESGGSCPGGQIVICGSVKSSLAEIRRVAAEYRDAGWDVLAPEPATDKAGPEMDRQWLAAIETAALVVIVPKPDGSLGESTSRERDHAHACDREVYVRVPASPDAVTEVDDHDCNASGHPPCDGDDGLVDELTADDLLGREVPSHG